MVFSGLLKPGSEQQRQRRPSWGAPGLDISPDRSNKASTALLDPPYISNDFQIPDIEAEPPELRDLNNSLAALAAIFPDVQVEVFREMLATFDKESRLAVVTEALIKNKMKWAGGRYKVVSKDTMKVNEAAASAASPDTTIVPVQERFRTTEYKTAVRNAAYNEFKGLSHSTVKAVLAEHNHSYTRARPTLASLHARSWRYSFTSLFSRKKPNPEQNHWVVWHSTGFGSIYPSLRTTGCAELDQELFESLVKPLLRKKGAEQIADDHKVALGVNLQQAEEADCLHDCECCYTSTTFEDLSACNEGGHFVCFQCIRHAVNEAVFGQGWANVDTQTGSLRCLAPAIDECHGCIPQSLVYRALAEEKGGDEIIHRLEERFVEDNLLKTQLPLVRCPFCSYAEIDEIYLPAAQGSWRLRRHNPYTILKIAFFVLSLGTIPLVLPLLVFFCVMLLLSCSNSAIYSFLHQHLSASINRTRRRQRGLRFNCQNPTCRRLSCMSCSKAWSDIHICHESSLVALRTQVELAMSLAIKRTCPRCNTSFVKSSGCNKLTCVCGYQMCYVCRKDIGNGGEGYRHFCEHFRPNGGRGCTECDKCDLYRCEDDDIVVTKAKQEAERLWMEKDEAGNETLKKVLVEEYGRNGHSSIWALWRRRPDIERALDAAVEFVIE